MAVPHVFWAVRSYYLLPMSFLLFSDTHWRTKLLLVSRFRFNMTWLTCLGHQVHSCLAYWADVSQIKFADAVRSLANVSCNCFFFFMSYNSYVSTPPVISVKHMTCLSRMTVWSSSLFLGYSKVVRCLPGWSIKSHSTYIANHHIK